MKIIKGTEKGFFAVCNDTARHISHCIKNKETWFVHWGPETLYYDKNKGENVWEYYFEQTHNLESQQDIVSDYIDLVLLKDNSFRATMNLLYSNYIKLNAETEFKLKPHFDFFEQNKVLGVHIRRTDKFLVGMHGTTFRHTPVDLEIFKREIDQQIDKYDFLYLATDCSEAVDFIKKQYGKKVVCNTNALRGNSTNSIHGNYRNLSGYVKGLNVLTDMILLSKCNHLIRSSSNVSVTSLYLNLDLTQDNLNEKYHGDSETDIL